MLRELDQFLKRLACAFEAIPKRLSEASEYLLLLLEKYSDMVLESIRIAVDNIYRFLRQMLINLIKTLWNVAKLVMILLFFSFLLNSGLEISMAVSAWYFKAVAYLLIVVGAAGTLFFLVGLISSLSRRTGLDSSVSKQGQRDNSRAQTVMRADFFLLELIILAISCGITLLTQYRFRSPLLLYAQDGIEMIGHHLLPLTRE